MEKLRNPITLRFMAAEKGWWGVGGEEVEWTLSVPPSPTHHHLPSCFLAFHTIRYSPLAELHSMICGNWKSRRELGIEAARVNIGLSSSLGSRCIIF